MKIGIGNDHAAVDMKKEISQYIKDKYGYEVINYGTDSNDSYNYAISGELVGNAIKNREIDRGILICGTGIGIGIAANKVKGVRCAICSDSKSIKLSREHNDANAVAFGARIIGIETAKDIVDAFLQTDFSNGERHNQRIATIKEIEERN